MNKNLLTWDQHIQNLEELNISLLEGANSPLTWDNGATVQHKNSKSQLKKV